MNLEEIKQYLEENKENEEVQAYLQDLQGVNQVTVEGVQQLVQEDDEFNKWLDSEKDKHFNRALSTWKTNNLKKLVDEEIKKRYPEESEEDLKYKELEQKIKQLEGEKTKESLSKKALEFATENNLPTNLASLFVSDDEDSTNENLQHFQEIWNNQVQKVKEQLIKDNGVDPKDSQEEKKFSTTDLTKMSSEEFAEYYEQEILNQDD